MRKQYHFRSSSRGLLAWDVDHLIAASRDLPPKPVPLSAIAELDEAYWSNESGSPLTCRDVAEHSRLIGECELIYPVILSSNGRVMDGMHRICKACLEGRQTIDAVRFVVDPDPDYVGVNAKDLPYR
jgi:hypothetical protein